MFPGETVLTRNHIITYAVLKYIYLEIFKDESRLEKNKKRSLYSSFPDYTRAWEIIEKEGYSKLIAEFKSKYHPTD